MSLYPDDSSEVEASVGSKKAGKVDDCVARKRMSSFSQTTSRKRSR